MQLDRLLNVALNILHGPSGTDAAGQVWNICAVVPLRFLNDDNIAHGCYFNRDCFKMLFSVHGPKSSLRWPGTVTLPGLKSCLYCRWLPLVTTSIQPSASSRWIISRTFM